MKGRAEVARFMEHQFSRKEWPLDKGSFTHYGRQELRELLDYIYDGKPSCEEEKVHND